MAIGHWVGGPIPGFSPLDLKKNGSTFFLSFSFSWFGWVGLEGLYRYNLINEKMIGFDPQATFLFGDVHVGT